MMHGLSAGLINMAIRQSYEYATLLPDLYEKVVKNNSGVLYALGACNSNYTVDNYANLVDTSYRSTFTPIWGCKLRIDIQVLQKQHRLMIYVCIAPKVPASLGCVKKVQISMATDSEEEVCAHEPGVTAEVRSSTIEVTPIGDKTVTWLIRDAKLYIHFYLYEDISGLSEKASKLENVQAGYLDELFRMDLVSTDASLIDGHESEDIDRDEPQTESPPLLVLYTVMPVLVVLVTAAVAIYRIHWSRQQKQRRSMKASLATLELSPILLKSLGHEVQLKLRPLLLSQERLEIQEELGRGAFGAVFKGVMHSQEGDIVNIQSVAVKSLTDNCIGTDITAFVNEAITMADLEHPHVLSVIGVCIDSKTENPMIVMPYMANGDLRTYLRRLRRSDANVQAPDEKQLLLFCLHIAHRMQYLSNQKIIHRDLAARNCMVDGNFLVQVADFGLARDVYSECYYRQDQQKALPIRWMASECLHDHVFNIQSDIWSFGVTMWEVFSMGRVPYMHLDNAKIATYLQTGERLEQPELCPQEMFDLMMQCFKDTPAERPAFTEIAEEISNHLAQICNYVDFNQETADRQSRILIRVTHGNTTIHSDDILIPLSADIVIQQADDIMPRKPGIL